MPEHAIYILEKFRAPFYHKGRKLYCTKGAVMKKYILLFLSFFLSLTISACAAQDSPIPAPAETARTESGENVREKGEALMRIPITANGRTWQAELEDSPAARALAAKMPLTLSLRDLYGRELCRGMRQMKRPASSDRSFLILFPADPLLLFCEDQQ